MTRLRNREAILSRGGRDQIRMHRPSDPDPDLGSAVWLVNGYPMVVRIWSREAWAGLVERPVHAQEFSGGCWGTATVV